MKLLLTMIACTLFSLGQTQARALLGTLNTPVVPTAATPTEAVNCSALNSLGFMNPSFLSRSETFKILKIKPLLTQEVSTANLQILKDSFMQATSVFKNNFEIELDSPASLIQTRARLLSSVGYNEKHLEKIDLLKLTNDDPRWKGALQKLSCNLQSCKSLSDATITIDAVVSSKTYKKDLESALLEQASESISVDEMLGGRVIPSERARLRLFSALLTQIGIQNETRWTCNKTANVPRFTSRVEVSLGKDTWASDTALSSDYEQKSAQICFSSLVKLSEKCSVKKGASL